jgi:asparagine synthase (glutamine-hydrolysing)
MCRIAGIIDKGSFTVKEDALAMREAMKHGGPDDSGCFYDQDLNLALVHRRLAIIDLSKEASQPMYDGDRDIVLSFNGEIYNYLQLKDQLVDKGYIFKTNSDTEVIIYAFKHWGRKCFAKLNGMFAIALFDNRSQALYLARDHAGIKPLYVYQNDSSLYFASEIRAFKELPNKWKEDESWKVYFLCLGYVPHPYTTLMNVFSLEKGTCLIVNTKDLSSEKYVFYKDEFGADINDYLEAKTLIAQSLQRAVAATMIADAPIGIFLSGGLDSAIIALLAAKINPNDLRTVSVTFDEILYNEGAFQKIVSNELKGIHDTKLIRSCDLYSQLDDIFEAMDQPTADGINTYFLCKQASASGLKAVLSGLGADELFGGYPSFNLMAKLNPLNTTFLSLLSYLPLQDKYQKLSYANKNNELSAYLMSRAYFAPKQIATILGANLTQVNRLLKDMVRPINSKNLSSGNMATLFESNLYMQGQLLKDTDMMSMWHGIEVRVPYLDNQFIKLVHTISSELKFGNKEPKYLLSQSFKAMLPKPIANRKKQGFTLPFEAWLRSPEIFFRYPTVGKAINKEFSEGRLNWSRYWAAIVVSEYNTL